jgi:hypothetical protein
LSVPKASLLGAATLLVAVSVSLATGCSLVVSTSDLTGGPPLDAGPADSDTDAGSDDAARPDTRDSASEAGNLLDAGEGDTGGPPDSDTTDAGSAQDSSVADARADSGTPDSGARDSSKPDSGSTVTTTDLTPTQDAYVQDTPYADTNFGTDTQLIVKTRSVPGYNRNSWLSFDIAGFTGITSAKLRLYLDSLDTAVTNTVPVVLYYPPDTADGWTASTITWNNAPAYGTNILGTVNLNNPQIGTWIEYDVTAAVAADSNGVSTFMLTSTPSTNRGALFDSSRGTSSPVLRITGVHP